MSDEELLGRSTVQVATSILENTPYTEGESRACFMSVWSTCNRAFDIIAKLVEDPNTPDDIKKLAEPLYLKTPTDWNIPLEVRIPPAQRAPDLYRKQQKRAQKDGRPLIVVPGYSKKEWEDAQKDAEKPSSLGKDEISST